jgi:threonine aldolase
MSAPIDLRSDTVTRPTPAMRAAMAAAPVGDDQFGEDPTVNALQARVAALLGKEAALFLPSGTMANQVALRVLTRPGDHVLIAREAHSAWHETGGSAANAGVQLAEIGARGVFTAEEFLAAAHPRGHMIYPPTTLVEIENTHNRAGGVIFPQVEALRICAAAREHEIASFLDGARLWNVAAATGTPLPELAAPFDLVAVALSKGLGAPGGSLLAGSRTLISAACATAACSAARCGRAGSTRRPGCSRSTTTSRGCRRTTRTRSSSRGGCPGARGSRSTSPACRRTSSSSTWRRARRTHPRSPRARRSAACSFLPSARG